MDRLWAPWRLSYVSAAKPDDADEPCFICKALAVENDREHLVVQRNPLSTVILNRFPYNNGHLLIAPRAHKGKLHELSADEILETTQCMQNMIHHLDELMHPDGYNIGLNLGRVAGAGLPGHLHWHIVPRWNGDTNFMPVCSDAKVIVQSLDSLYDLLHQRLNA